MVFAVDLFEILLCTVVVEEQDIGIARQQTCKLGVVSDFLVCK